LEHKIGINLTVSLTLKKPSKNYTFLFWDRLNSFINTKAKTFFIKYLTKLRMNVKNMMLHYSLPEDAKVKFSEIIIFLMTLSIFIGKPYLYRI